MTGSESPFAARVLFTESGTHKTIEPDAPRATGKLRVSDQATIDALREAFERAGWQVVDR